MFDPTGHGILSWREIGSLFGALGLPSVITERLLRNIGVEKRPNSSLGMTYQEWLKMLGSPYFHYALGEVESKSQAELTFKTIQTALKYVAAGWTTFADIKALRIAVEFAESGVSLGVPSDPDSLATTLRMAGRTIGPQQLKIWVKERERVFSMPGRLQLFEMFELLFDTKSDKEVAQMDASHSDLSRTGMLDNGTFELAADAVFLPPRKRQEKVVEVHALAEATHKAAIVTAEKNLEKRLALGRTALGDMAAWRYKLPPAGASGHEDVRPHTARPNLGRTKKKSKKKQSRPHTAGTERTHPPVPRISTTRQERPHSARTRPMKIVGHASPTSEREFISESSVDGASPNPIEVLQSGAAENPIESMKNFVHSKIHSVNTTTSVSNRLSKAGRRRLKPGPVAILNTTNEQNGWVFEPPQNGNAGRWTWRVEGSSGPITRPATAKPLSRANSRLPPGTSPVVSNDEGRKLLKRKESHTDRFKRGLNGPTCVAPRSKSVDALEITDRSGVVTQIPVWRNEDDMVDVVGTVSAGLGPTPNRPSTANVTMDPHRVFGRSQKSINVPVTTPRHVETSHASRPVSDLDSFVRPGSAPSIRHSYKSLSMSVGSGSDRAATAGISKKQKQRALFSSKNVVNRLNGRISQPYRQTEWLLHDSFVDKYHR